MAFLDLFKKVTLKGAVIGGVFIAAGVASFLLAYSANADIADLSPTTDQAILQHISDLKDLRGLYINLGFGAVFIGIFTVFVLTGRTLPAEIAQRQMMSQAKMTHELVSNLNLKGNAAYIPAKFALTREKVLIPATDNALSLPIMTDDLVFSLGADKATLGIFLTPSGLDLLDGFERDLDVSNKDVGLEALEGNMQIAKLGLGLVKDFKVKEREGEVILRIEQSSFYDACRTARATMPDVCRQVACPICSAFMTGIARATGKIAKITSVENETDRVQFHMKLVEWK